METNGVLEWGAFPLFPYSITPSRIRGGGWGLVVFPVFKTAWGAVDPVLGGFDSHTLPPSLRLPIQGVGGSGHCPLRGDEMGGPPIARFIGVRV